ncbi:2OG-Fe(II)-dependent halogenase WelO5 family protein [Streptomyces albogriseolus]|uniref:2OG-Fe(II)-dependent halogenase WelO5 family protein n=1 Tax=Streptomyces albogriseolus TaxID=1887 RepID=UPI0037013468
MGTDSASAHVTEIDPHFGVRIEKRLTRHALLDLACGLAGAVVVRDFAPQHLLTAINRRLGTFDLVRYSRSRYPLPAFRLGPVLNEFNSAKKVHPDYWAQAEAARAVARQPEIARIRDHCTDRLGAAWNSPVGPATHDGRALFWGILREINSGTLTHWDDVVHELDPDLFDDRPICQLAFNLFLSTPRSGGQTTIWRRRWQPTDERHRKQFGYEEKAVTEGCQEIEVLPLPGDAVLFDPRNYHAVHSSGTGRRVTVSFFVGITAERGLVLWS